MNMCIDEGTLQGYLDGELSPDMQQAVAMHLAACVNCAETAYNAEQEFALFADALAPVMAVNVPSARLRERLDEAIAEKEATPRSSSQTSVNSRARALFAALSGLFTFTPQRAAAFASLLVAVLLTVVFLTMRTQHPTPVATVAENNSTVPVPAISVFQPPGNNDAKPTVTVGTAPPNSQSERRVVIQKVRNSLPTSGVRGVRGNDAVKPTEEAKYVLLPGERNYLETIATLKTAIETQRNQTMTPTLRAEYERNLAVVDQAIIATRVAARRNPKDADAREFLHAAYQNKVELLTAVADQAQLASAR